MPFNLIKNYPDLLEISQYNLNERDEMLRKIFDRDIQENQDFNFREKTIYPLKTDGDIDMDTLFNHLITKQTEIEDETGRRYKKRVFENDRSIRLHWVKFHIDEQKEDKIEIFSVEERDQVSRTNVLHTYIWNVESRYVIVLEVQRHQRGYFLLSAHYLNEKWGPKKMKKKLKKKLADVL